MLNTQIPKSATGGTKKSEETPFRARLPLANYRATTIRDQAESIADQLSSELSSLEANFQSFLDDAVGNGDTKFSGFLVHGLNDLKKRKFVYRRNRWAVHAER